MDNGWLGRLLQVFGPLLAAWSAFLAFLVHLKKIRNSEKAAAHGRIVDELDRVYEALKVSREECEMLRDFRSECEAQRIEWMGRAVKAEAIVQGYGEARQMRAVEESMKRLEENGRQGNGDDA